MKKVRIDKLAFIARVKENRDKHRANFEAAQEGYKKFMITELEKRLEEAQRGLKVDRYIRLEEPEDHTEDYDQILEMAEMSVDETIEIDQTEFAWYVMDRWAWKQQWVATNSAYTVIAE
jgi:hypothetical protein